MAQSDSGLTEVQILSGSNVIGGNFVKIADGDSTLVFDQGVRFDIFSRYFSRWVQPKGIMELRKLGVVPREDWYKDVQNIYISHLHLDHLGALSNIPEGIRVHLPSNSIYPEMKKRWENSPSWMNLVPENYYLKVEDYSAIVEDRNKVMAIPVSHSAYPAFSFLYFGKDRTILYTGDMRIRSFLDAKDFKSLHKGPGLLDYLQSQHDLKIDTLILEGTNFGSERSPVLPSAAASVIEKVMAGSDLVIVTCHHLDTEFLLAILSFAKKMDFKTFVSSEMVAKSIGMTDTKLDFKVLEESVETPLFETAPTQDLLAHRSLLITSYYEIIDLFRALDESSLKGRKAVCILTEPEPASEEMQEYDQMSRWLSLWGIQSYRIRVSGHYYPFDLEEILSVIKPKEVVPIHTSNSNLMMRLVRAYQTKSD